MNARSAIIDLGTNTFHLLVVEKKEGAFKTLYQESLPARIGMGGINNGKITPEAHERALQVLRLFRSKLDEFAVGSDQTIAIGTSAIRNATNGGAFCKSIFEQTAISIQIVDGDQEAAYIYQGVRAGVILGKEPGLIMDIGGGSVEFIIGNDTQIFWKQSFEIGGQRLMEKFMKHDPLSQGDRKRLYSYLEEQLIPLANAVHQYAPIKIVGSSGSFDTLIDMESHNQTKDWPPAQVTDFRLPIEAFYNSYEQLLSTDHDGRRALAGMIELRADMIVVAVCLIDYVLRTFGIRDIQVSRYSLKEGVLASLMTGG
jgi:exopolyphosphatase / guanosine-5'-triphosphate,3'-diphosphate pyrophosphatase